MNIFILLWNFYLNKIILYYKYFYSFYFFWNVIKILFMQIFFNKFRKDKKREIFFKKFMWDELELI